MKIGLDIDNVVTNFDDEVLKQFLEADKLKRGNGIINQNASHITKGMFDWSKEEVEEFFANNMENIAKILKPLPNCKFFIDKLLSDGHEIFFISHRTAPHYRTPYKTTKNWLNKNKINYTKLIISKGINKTEECKKFNIDVMIDDRLDACEQMISENINCWLMKTNFHKENKNNVFVVNNWEDIYNNIKKIEKENVILDTDITNEIDDQFALAYLLKSLDVINLNAITLAPYKKRYNFMTENDSFDATINILKIMQQEKFSGSIFKGATKYFFESSKLNDASKKIIEICRNNKQTTIICIGAITNVAVALFHAPDIAKKIKIVWLGGCSFLVKNTEFNFTQDIKAAKFVFKHAKNLTVIPTKNVADVLKTTTLELEHYLKSKIGLHLAKTFTEYINNRAPNDFVGQSKTLWDIAATIYVVYPQFFKVSKISCPKIDTLGQYHQTKFGHKINFVCEIDRNKVFKDMFLKLG